MMSRGWLSQVLSRGLGSGFLSPVVGLVRTAIINSSLLNGGFETAGAGGADAFGSWSEPVAGTSTVTRDTAVFDTGAASCRLNIDASNSTAGVTQAILTAGRSYAYSIRAKADAACDIKIGSSTNSDVLTLTTGWVTYTGVFVAVVPTFQIARNSAASRAIWVDSVTLERIG